MIIVKLIFNFSFIFVYFRNLPPQTKKKNQLKNKTKTKQKKTHKKTQAKQSKLNQFLKMFIIVDAISLVLCYSFTNSPFFVSTFVKVGTIYINIYCYLLAQKGHRDTDRPHTCYES